jgi:hypothetical protein
MFFLSLLIVGVYKGYWFFEVDFVSCYFAEAGILEFWVGVFQVLKV